MPYITSITAGVLLYILGIFSNDDLKGLLINISSAFLSIPLLYLFYDLFRKRSQKKLNAEIYNYAKVQVDNEVVSIIRTLMKLVYPLDKQELTNTEITNFLWIPVNELKTEMLSGKYLGFQILKKWEKTDKYFQDILKNSFFISKMDDDKLLAIISIMKSVRTFESAFSVENLYLPLNEYEDNYKIAGNNNSGQGESNDRLILLKKLNGEHFYVQDFGDFIIGDKKNY